MRLQTPHKIAIIKLALVILAVVAQFYSTDRAIVFLWLYATVDAIDRI